MNISTLPELTLNEALKHLDSENLPDKLPFFHTTTIERMKGILDTKSLLLTPCDVFRKELLYFFYGGPFYRPTAPEFADEISCMPIAFMLKPSILKYATCFFPYDTGAAENGIYGKPWNSTLAEFEKFRMNGDESILAPRKFIRHIYGDNRNYFDGELIAAYHNLPDPIPMIGDFYTEMRKKWQKDRSPDTRRWKIECHFERQIPLKNNVLWIAVPRLLQKDLIEFNKALGDDKPKFHFYQWKGDRDAEHIINTLEDEAIKYLEEHNYLPMQ